MKYPQVVSMPSAVSNWLEEQLEARGIDAVVYTRYILSLLHSHTVDVLYPEEDFQFSHSHSKKEVRRSNRGYIGSHRSSSDWWRHANADAERIKRSAAVECLLSASEQNCEIESLVDELCEKLKEVNSESTSPSFTSSEVITETSTEAKKITPQELAEKYYAAFPPLCPQSLSKESKLPSLIPKWRNATSSSSSSVTSPVKKKSTKKVCKPLSYGNRSYSRENNDMKARNHTKRFNCFPRNKNNLRNNSAFNNWDLSFLTTKKLSEIRHKQDEPEIEDSMEQCVEMDRDDWNEDELNLYDDLPVDIIDLLDSPRPHDHTVEMMNIANMRDTGKRKFIPYGTNIISSIWSTDQDVTFDNKFNATIDTSLDNTANNMELTLDYKFSAISIDNPINNVNFDDWPPANSIIENKTNALLENDKKFRRRLFSDGFPSLKVKWSIGGDETEEIDAGKECFENDKLLAFSLMKLNHNKEKSCFSELTPRSAPRAKPFQPFGMQLNPFSLKYTSDPIDDKEDLLTSERSHFKPICEKDEAPQQSKYADGATFVISNNLEKVDYKRSKSGTLWLETENGQSKKYYEYKTPNNCSFPDPDQFVLKFSICGNDKACQTDEYFSDSEDIEYAKIESTMNICELPTFPEEQQKPQQNRCTCPDNSANTTSVLNNEYSQTCPVHVIQRPESMLSEVVWKYEEKSCEKCRGNDLVWSNGDWSGGHKGQADSDWDETGLRSIWSDGEVCQKCLTLNASRPTHNHQLREDISQDGEKLLSDLSTIQKCYMDDIPVAEQSFDISELLSSSGESKDQKRRHSLIIDSNVDSWSFALRIEEDCLKQMSALPALRAVTL